MASEAVLSHLPRFVPGAADEPGGVLIADRDWARLLVRLDCTDNALWPPALATGAALLATIRRIEADCIAAHGGFDWEGLSPELQDEYDGSIAALEQLLTAESDWEDWESVRAKLGLRVA